MYRTRPLESPFGGSVFPRTVIKGVWYPAAGKERRQTEHTRLHCVEWAWDERGSKRGRCAQILELRKIEMCGSVPDAVIFGVDHDVLEGWMIVEESGGEVVDTRHYLEVA